MERRPPPDDPTGFPPDDEEGAGPTGLDEEVPPGGYAADAAPRGLLPEGVKKAILAGVGALFMTEEGARKLARDWKLPKELVGFVGSQASAAKDELLRALGAEIRRFLESDAIRREFLKALADNTIEIHAEIRLRPPGERAAAPEVKATGTVKRGRRPRGKKAGA